MSKNQYDAIIVGGGHNGLIAACYLQKAGKKTLVLERRHMVGGACVTEEIFPGFKMSTTSYVCSLLRPEIIDQLDLKRHGYAILERNPSSFSPFPDGRYLMFWKDMDKTCAEIAKFSKKDAKAYPLFEKKLEELSQFVQPLLMSVPPDPSSSSLSDLVGSLKLAMRARALKSEMYDHVRVFSMSVAEYLDSWFESEAIKTRMATDGIIGAWAGPETPGTAYVLFHHVMGETEGKPGVWGYVKGGMGGLTQALAKSYLELGGEIRTEAPVEKILVSNNRAKGVVLENGDDYYAKKIFSNADPKRTFLKLVEAHDLPSEFLESVNQFRMKSGTVKINLAMEGLPNFKACPGTEVGPQHKGTIHFCPTVEYMEKAFEEAKRGLPSEQPAIEMTIPSTVDPTLAPPGKHVVSLFVQYAPYKRADGRDWDETTKKEYAESCFKVIESYAPGFTSQVLHYQVLTPIDLEREYGLTGGNIMHGEMTLDQLFFMRPLPKYANFKTPIENLYMCGAGSHPGGGIMGAPGYLAAKRALKDEGLGRFF